MKTKKLYKIVGMIILLVFFLMTVTLAGYQGEDESPLGQISYYYDEDWLMVSLREAQLGGSALENAKQIQERLEAALTEGDYQAIELPYEGRGESAAVLGFQNTLPAGLTIHFSSDNAKVRVTADGEAVYQYGFSGEETAGTHENSVNLPSTLEEGKIWIELQPSSAGIAPALGDVIVETSDSLVIGVVGNSIADIGCCLLIIMMSILMFVLELIRRHTNQPSRGEVYLGLAGLVVGIYSFIGTHTLSIFYDVWAVYEIQEYLVLLMPLFLALYFDWNQHQFFPRRFTVLLGYVSANAAIQILLQLIHVRTMKEMVHFSALAVGIVCVTAIVTLLQFDYKNRKRQTLLSVLSLLGLLVGGIVNAIMNYIYLDTSSNMVGQYSVTVFSVMIAAVHVLQISREYRANAEENARLLAEKVKEMEQQNQLLVRAKGDAEAARQEALAANEAKGKFLAHMSHEIRTPINAVLGMDEMILREAKEQSIKEYAMDIHTAGQTLLSLVNDILDFSKIESGKMEIVPVEYDVSSLIHDLANMAIQRAADKKIRFEVEVDHETPSRLYGDDVRLRQVLTNILTNAVKYTHEGCVWLRVQSRKRERMAVLRFEVEDTGIGIKEEDLPKLFAEFERIEEKRNRNIEGTGLGMSITTQLLTLLDSRLQVESVYGKGSKFYFELEQRIVDATPIGDFETRVHQLAENYSYSAGLFAPDAKVLVVDDNAMNRKVLRNLLKETQIQVAEAAGGRECLELVQKNYYDLIFLDHMMPEMDGVETLHHIKALSDYPCQGTPIVVLTANAVSGAKEKYLAEGFDDFLSKPIVPEKLEKMIRKMLPEELLLKTVSVSRTDEAERTDAAEELPVVDGLDWNYARMHLPDRELLQYTVKEFYAQIESAAAHLEQAYERLPEPGVLEQYRIQVHAMKSLAATVGILPLSGVAKILEYAAKDDKLEVIRSLTKVFLDEWRGYSRKLRGVFGIETEAKKEVTDYSVMRAFVEMVRIGMQEMDIDQADQAMGQLQAYTYPEAMASNIQKLAKAVTNLDLDETEHLAELLIRQMEE